MPIGIGQSLGNYRVVSKLGSGGMGAVYLVEHPLIGKKVGSRVLLVIPPKDGYGEQGNPQGGISGTDTLVFVVDILDAY